MDTNFDSTKPRARFTWKLKNRLELGGPWIVISRSPNSSFSEQEWVKINRCEDNSYGSELLIGSTTAD